VPAFSAAAAREQELSCQQMPRLAELQVSSSASAAKTSAASKKKLMSMAFQAQKQRREVAAAAAAAAAAAETGSNADTVSSSDNEISPARERENTTSQISGDQSLVDGVQREADGSCMTEQEQCATAPQPDTASLSPVCQDDYELCDSCVADSTDVAVVVRSAAGIAAQPPKTLTPAKTLPVSLVAASDLEDRRQSIDDVLSSPVKLLPPADPQHIHAIVTTDVPSMTSDLETVQPDQEYTEEL